MGKVSGEKQNRNREIVAVLATTAAMLGIYAVVQSTPVQDWWKGLTYDETTEVKTLRESLSLTEKGERIFLATQPRIEEAEDFNGHCDSHHADVALLGCYVNDKMYVYRVDQEDLKDSNKVTAAHELLHAAWARMEQGERETVKRMLEQVEQQNPKWVSEELDLYDDTEKTEELYTRVGTKLQEIPEDLEEHYRQYFTNRLKIVEYYENYQAPFNELKERNAELKIQIDQMNAELLVGKDEYERRMRALEAEVDSFNACAASEGCFRSDAEFARRRGAIQTEYIELEKLRNELNAKIDENNALVLEYNENQRKLGDLHGILNSNVEKLSE